MNVRIIKEVRPLLPAFALTLSGLVITLIHFSKHLELEQGYFWVLLLSAFGCVLMGIASFGDEFSNRTMSLLLTHPLSRRTIWREKMTALGLAIGALAAFVTIVLIYFCFDIRNMYAPGVIVMIALPLVFGLGVFCTTPFWTLALKNIPAAVAGVIAMPFGS